MTRIHFVDRASGVRAELARELYVERGGDAPTGASPADLVVDVETWNLADPVGACQAELDELRAQIARRVAELPL
jgi:hypothetical protein